MKRLGLLTIILVLLTNNLFGQKAVNPETTHFLKFDTLLSKLNTDKIVFKVNNDLDINKSKQYLDSIIWFMVRHPNTIIEIKLNKGIDKQYCSSKIGQLQAEQIGRYLIGKGINFRRLAINGTHCGGQLNITDQELKTKSTDKNKLTTLIIVLSFDYVDKQK